MRTEVFPDPSGVDPIEQERKGTLAVEAMTAVMLAVMDGMDVESVTAVCGASVSYAFKWMAKGGLPQDLWEQLRDNLAAGISAMDYFNPGSSGGGEVH